MADDPLFVLRIRKPDEWLTLNRHGTRGSRFVVQSLKKSWADATTWAARDQLRRSLWWPTRPLPPCRLEWTFQMSTARNRDPDNFILTRKPILDALVREGVWLDDSPEFVSNGEIVFTYPFPVEGVVVRAYPLSKEARNG